jgi:DivIVA domain-containing protein
VVSGEPPEPAQRDIGGSSASPEEGGDATQREAPASSEIAEVSFPISVRGYDRRAVDAYVSRVQDVFAELEATRSPEAAVKQALAQVGEQTKRILEQAGETAEQITGTAERKAEDSTARTEQEAASVAAAAKAEAAEIVARSQADSEATIAGARKKAADHLQSARAETTAMREEAEARLRELQADTESIRRERSQLLNDLHQLSARVEEVAGAADTRFPPPEVAEGADEGEPHGETAGEGAASEEAATDDPIAEAENRQHPSA